jgi:hypothetical protein
MAIVLYATWLYGNADRRAASSKEATAEYRPPIDEEIDLGSTEEKPILPR